MTLMKNTMVRNFYKLFDLKRYHNKMVPLRFTIIHMSGKKTMRVYFGQYTICLSKTNEIVQVYMYKVVKLAPSSQVASKRGLTTFNSLSLSSQNDKTKLFLAYLFIFVAISFQCRNSFVRQLYFQY